MKGNKGKKRGKREKDKKEKREEKGREKVASLRKIRKRRQREKKEASKYYICTCIFTVWATPVEGEPANSAGVVVSTPLPNGNSVPTAETKSVVVSAPLPNGNTTFQRLKKIGKYHLCVANIIIGLLCSSLAPPARHSFPLMNQYARKPTISL